MDIQEQGALMGNLDAPYDLLVELNPLGRCIFYSARVSIQTSAPFRKPFLTFHAGNIFDLLS